MCWEYIRIFVGRNNSGCVGRGDKGIFFEGGAAVYLCDRGTALYLCDRRTPVYLGDGSTVLLL